MQVYISLLDESLPGGSFFGTTGAIPVDCQPGLGAAILSTPAEGPLYVSATQLLTIRDNKNAGFRIALNEFRTQCIGRIQAVDATPLF